MIFEAGYNMGPNPEFATSNVIQTLWFKKVSHNPWQTDNQKDWLVGILDRDMSTPNGYLGQVAYSSSQNGLNIWDMTSYPTDFSFLAEAQVLQGPMAVIGVAGEGNPSELYYMNGIVVSPSEYGSPVYDNEYRLMGIVGTQWGYPNIFQVLVQGGRGLTNLIETAKKVSP
jgi:hypothetical protein